MVYDTLLATDANFKIQPQKGATSGCPGYLSPRGYLSE
jgi:hypothetical protein